MTFWQENYGFVKEVYDFRMQKYQEWMDNLEAIVNKVLSQDIQYTYKEFRLIQDSLDCLCRDLEKEGMKEWLDMMLEKVTTRVIDDVGGSARDKELKTRETKRLKNLIDRHEKLLPPTRETQQKVETYAQCYAFSDELGGTNRLLEEMLMSSTREIHPTNLNSVKEFIDRQERVCNTITSVEEKYNDFITRGQRLIGMPKCAPFLKGLLMKFKANWDQANEKSKERMEWLGNIRKSFDDLQEKSNNLTTDYKKKVETLTNQVATLKETVRSQEKQINELTLKLKAAYKIHAN